MSTVPCVCRGVKPGKAGLFAGGAMLVREASCLCDLRGAVACNYKRVGAILSGWHVVLNSEPPPSRQNNRQRGAALCQVILSCVNKRKRLRVCSNPPPSSPTCCSCDFPRERVEIRTSSAGNDGSNERKEVQ